ncbi:MAG: LexA-binding, inner rane-associated putative hydrolase [Bacteroidota bacterium]|jgi:membrane-bound metal-dependent hydrolase YbcI (DUF457 family)
MTSKTHVALGLLTALTIKYLIPYSDTYTLITGVCIGSLFPDLDTKKSDPSQIFPPVCYVIDKMTKHRGATHQIFPILFIIIWFFTRANYMLYLGVGAFSHSLIDIITLAINIRCGSTGEQILYYFCWISNLVLAIYLILGKK